MYVNGVSYKMSSDPRGSRKRPRSDEEDKAYVHLTGEDDPAGDAEALEPSVDPNYNNGFPPWWPRAGAPENPGPHCQAFWTYISIALLLSFGWHLQNNQNRNNKK